MEVPVVDMSTLLPDPELELVSGYSLDTVESLVVWLLEIPSVLLPGG